MRASELKTKKTNPGNIYKLWTAVVRIKQPGYTAAIDATVTATNAFDARRLMKAQYGIDDRSISSVRELKVK